MRNAFNHSEQHIKDYLQALLNPYLGSGQVLTYARLVTDDDLAGCWQAQAVLKAVKDAATLEGLLGTGSMTPMDVHQELMQAGRMNNPAMSAYWLALVSPPTPPPETPPAKIPVLARRVVEDAYRQRHSDVFGEDAGSWATPLDELFQQVEASYQQLQAIKKRLGGADRKEKAA